MDVRFHVDKEQAKALTAFFNYWTYLGGVGSSRVVGFNVDGDGNFQPNCQIMTSEPLGVMTNEEKAAVIIEDNGGDRLYDYDALYEIERRKIQAKYTVAGYDNDSEKI